jgi:beta-glucosidase
MSLDGAQIIGMTGQDGRRVVDSAPISLAAGSRHSIHIEYAATRPLTGLQPGGLLLQWKPPAAAESPALQQAVSAARAARVAVVYVRDFESEERDRVSLKLPQSADQLISAVAAVNPRTIVVLASGGPVTMPWLHSVAGVVQTYFGGQAQGAAVADVLFGDVNPSGRLPLTYPASESSVPIANPWAGTADLNVRYSEKLNVGYKAYDSTGTKPLFPFGFGLTYSSFRYDRVGTHPARFDRASGTLHVTFRLTNTGTRTATETAQVYVGLPSRVGEPKRRLAGYDQVTLAAGASTVVDIAVSASASTHPLSYYDVAAQRWVMPRGDYRVYVGGSAGEQPIQANFHIG